MALACSVLFTSLAGPCVCARRRTLSSAWPPWTQNTLPDASNILLVERPSSGTHLAASFGHFPVLVGFWWVYAPLVIFLSVYVLYLNLDPCLDPHDPSLTSNAVMYVAPLRLSAPSLTISAPFRAITLPACSQLCLDLDDDEWENTVFEPAKEVLLRFISTDDNIAQGVSKVWTLLGMLADVAGPLGLRRVYVYTDVAVLSRQVRVGLCRKLGSF